jgi:hypothetical protein
VLTSSGGGIVAEAPKLRASMNTGFCIRYIFSNLDVVNTITNGLCPNTKTCFFGRDDRDLLIMSILSLGGLRQDLRFMTHYLSERL